MTTDPTSPVPAVPVPEEERAHEANMLRRAANACTNAQAGMPSDRGEWFGWVPKFLNRLADAQDATPPAPVVGEGERGDEAEVRDRLDAALRAIAADLARLNRGPSSEVVTAAADELERLRALPAAPTTHDIADERVRTLIDTWQDRAFYTGNTATEMTYQQCAADLLAALAAPSTPGDGQPDPFAAVKALPEWADYVAARERFAGGIPAEHYDDAAMEEADLAVELLRAIARCVRTGS